MDEWMERRRITRLVWGMFLIAFGAAFLLERFGVIELPPMEDLWPVFLWVLAIVRTVEGRIGSAMTLLLLGAWFFACTFGWWGFGYHNSWPLVLVAVGAGIVIKAVTGEDERWKERMRQRLAERMERKSERWMGERHER
jgi:hypothetical protein